MGNTFKRRKYFINKRVQSKFILRFVLVSVIGTIIAVCAFNFLAHRKIESVLYSMRLPAVSTGGLLFEEMTYAIIFTMVIIVLTFFVTAKRLFNRINGPLKKIAASLDKIRYGDLGVKIQLRQKDEFQDFADELNEMVRGLNDRFARIKGQVDELISLSDDGREELESDDLRDAINMKVANLEKELRFFKR